MRLQPRTLLLITAVGILAGSFAISQQPAQSQISRPVGNFPRVMNNPFESIGPAQVPAEMQHAFNFNSGFGPNENQRDRELESLVRKLIEEYRHSPGEDNRAKIAKDLNSHVAEQFNARQDYRKQELERMEAELKRLRSVHEERTVQKDRIVSDRVEQLLREVDGLGWGSTPSGGPDRGPSYSGFGQAHQAQYPERAQPSTSTSRRSADNRP